MRQSLELRRFARDTSYNISRQAAGILVALGTSVLLARGLGPTDRGLYAVALLLPTLLAAFLNAGISPATVYLLARGEAKTVVAAKTNIALALAISAPGLLIGWLLVHFCRAQLFPGVASSLLLLSLGVLPLSLMTAFLVSIFQGLHDFRRLNLVSLVPQLVNFALLWIGFRIFPGSTICALAAFLIGNFAGLAVLLFLLSRDVMTSLSRTWIPEKSHLGPLLRYGIKSHLGNLLGFLNYRVDMFLLNFLAGATPVGFYSVSVTIAERLWIVSTSASTVILPRIASMADTDARRGELTAVVTRHVLWFSIIMAIGVWLVADYAILLLYSSAFRESARILVWLLPGIIALSISRILANDIAGRGFPGLNSLHSAIGLVVNVVANIILIPRYAGVGAALSTSFSYSLVAVLRLRAYLHLAKIPLKRVVWFGRSDFVRLKRIPKMLKKRSLQRDD